LKHNTITSLAYRTIGKKIGGVYKHLEELRTEINKANIKLNFEAYVSTIIFLSIINTGIAITITSITIIILKLNIITQILFLAISLLTGTLTFITGYYYPFYRSGNRKREIDNAMPYITSLMAVLARSGIHIQEIFKTLAKIEKPKEVAYEAKDIMTQINVFGRDIITAIERKAETTPSDYFAEVLLGLATIMKVGEDIEAYLMNEAERFITIRKTIVKETNSILSSITEIYIITAILLPMLLIVMMTIISMLGGIILGINAALLMDILTIIIIPTTFAMFLIVTDTIIPEE